jgi:hypothetical protein
VLRRGITQFGFPIFHNITYVPPSLILRYSAFYQQSVALFYCVYAFQKKQRLLTYTEFTDLIFMGPCIVDYSVEIPTRCIFVIEFVIPKFLKAQHVSSIHRSSSGALNCICSLWFIYPYDDQPLPRLSGHSVPTQPWQRPITIWAYKSEAANIV